MTAYLVAFAGGMLTVLSPCILPVLPFVFARSDRPFAQGGLPLLAGMALTFAAVASLAAAGAWAAQVNAVGRWVALAALGVSGASLLFPRLAAWWTRPLVQAGARLARREVTRLWLASALLGVATGLVWSPCAGPALGVILSTAALAGPGVRTSLLLLSYGAGAAVALAGVARVGTRALARSWSRRIVGAAMLAGVVAIASGLDTRVLATLSGPGSTALEARVLQAVMPGAIAAQGDAAPARPSSLPVESTQASLEGGSQWLNGPSQSIPALRGHVVLVNFWTYSCVNCLRTLPYVKAWAAKYADRGLIVVGVHTPEFAFEKETGNVQRALQDLKITWPVVQDNQFRIWRAFDNQAWPALYFVDAQGRVRHHHFGEGGYAASERVIQELLREAGAKPSADAAAVQPDLRGLGMAADLQTLRSGETYLGYEKGGAARVAARVVPDQAAEYQPDRLRHQGWSLSGNWTVRPEWVEANRAGDVLTMRFEARDANLVLGRGSSAPIRFRVTLDGQPPGAEHGADVDSEGNGVLDASRLYQLVRQRSGVKARTLEVHLLDPGARAYAFTFG